MFEVVFVGTLTNGPCPYAALNCKVSDCSFTTQKLSDSKKQLQRPDKHKLGFNKLKEMP